MSDRHFDAAPGEGIGAVDSEQHFSVVEEDEQDSAASFVPSAPLAQRGFRQVALAWLGAPLSSSGHCGGSIR